MRFQKLSALLARLQIRFNLIAGRKMFNVVWTMSHAHARTRNRDASGKIKIPKIRSFFLGVCVRENNWIGDKCAKLNEIIMGK